MQPVEGYHSFNPTTREANGGRPILFAYVEAQIVASFGIGINKLARCLESIDPIRRDIDVPGVLDRVELLARSWCPRQWEDLSPVHGEIKELGPRDRPRGGPYPGSQPERLPIVLPIAEAKSITFRSDTRHGRSQRFSNIQRRTHWRSQYSRGVCRIFLHTRPVGAGFDDGRSLIGKGSR